MIARNKYKETPLHLASYRGRVGVARLLVNLGADTEIQNKDGHTPLQLALYQGQSDVTNMFRLEVGLPPVYPSELFDEIQAVGWESSGEREEYAGAAGNRDNLYYDNLYQLPRLALETQARGEEKKREGRTASRR